MWHATLYGVTKSQTWLSDWNTRANQPVTSNSLQFYILIKNKNNKNLKIKVYSIINLWEILHKIVHYIPLPASGNYTLFFLISWALLKVKVESLSHVWPFGTTWAVAYQAPPSMGFSRQEYWNGLPVLSPGDLPNPGIKPGSPTLKADTLPSEPPGKPWWALLNRFYA